MDEELKAIYNKALNTYGINAQLSIIIEECGELITEITRIKRGRTTKEKIITELADVQIMIEQIAFYYGLDNFLKEKNRKLRRLVERLNKQ